MYICFMEKIICKVCKKEKEKEYFYKDKESKNGYRTKCKQCTKEGKRIRPIWDKNNYDIKLKSLQGDNYKIVSDYNKDVVEILHLKCGKIRKSTPSNALIRGCPYCKSNSSYITRIFHTFLKYNKIEYEFEYIIDDCKSLKPLPFDFALFKNHKLLCLVEIDGEQHYKGNKRFNTKEIRKRDTIKTNYCNSNNIDLVRIPYNCKNIEVEFENVIKKYNITPKNNFEIKDDYYSTEEASEIRKLYLNVQSIRKITTLIKKDFTYISKIIKYIYFPNQDLDIKKQIEDIYISKTETINRQFSDLSNHEIEEMIKYIKKGVSSIAIANKYNINRKNKHFLKIYNSNKLNFRTTNNKYIEQYKDNILINIYENTSKIIEKNPNYSINTIVSCCNGHKPSYKGYKWVYKDKLPN